MTSSWYREAIFKRVLECLNASLVNDPEAFQALFSYRVPCNNALANDPFIVVKEEISGINTLGVLGLLNGVFAAAGLPTVKAIWSASNTEQNDKLLGFERHNPY